MKLFKNVEKSRIAYHKHPNKNTVHRSSLLVPCKEGFKTTISFLNHFLIKRNNNNVTCKITAIDKFGYPIDSYSYKIYEPIVYVYELDTIFENNKNLNLFNIEFFSSDNLFIPFPAVIINHIGRDSINIVHSFARILNDPNENKAINEINVNEASIDCLVNREYDTFICFIAGPFEEKSIDKSLNFSLNIKNITYTKEFKLKLKPMSCEYLYLSELFPKLGEVSDAIIKIKQPNQNLFYGRLFAGIIHRRTKAFSANHSFYDTSEISEYFENSISTKIYPYFKNYINEIIFYPIMSKGEYQIFIEFDSEDKSLSSKPFSISSCLNSTLCININQLVTELNLSSCTAYKVIALSKENIPTRMTFQLRHRPLNSKSHIQSSVTVGLSNSSVYRNPNQNSFIWGQIINDKEYIPNLGICFEDEFEGIELISISFFDQFGIISTQNYSLKSKCALILSGSDFKDFSSRGKYLWYLAKSNKPDLSAHYFHVNKKSLHGSGEHSF